MIRPRAALSCNKCRTEKKPFSGLTLIRVPDLLHEDLVRLMGEVVLTLARQEAV
jgi:hypothetical protein